MTQQEKLVQDALNEANPDAQQEIILEYENLNLIEGGDNIEKWSKNDDIYNSKLDEALGIKSKRLVEIAGEGKSGLRKAFNTAQVLENTQKQIVEKLHETQVSQSFNGLTTTNLLTLIRLGYENSIRGDIFTEIGAKTMTDFILYLDPIYASTLRGATAGQITYETVVGDYPSETDPVTIDGAGAGTAYSYTYANVPIVPGFVSIYLEDSSGVVTLVAKDDGAGTLVDVSTNGNLLDTGAANDVDYVTGDININFLSAPNLPIYGAISADFENPSNYDQFGDLELRLRRYDFIFRPFPLNFRWSIISDLLLGSTTGINTEQTFIDSAKDELMKAFDIRALKQGFAEALASGNIQTFDASAASTGEDSTVHRAQVLMYAIKLVGAEMKNLKNRGGVTKMYVGSLVAAYLHLVPIFKAEPNLVPIGAHKIGTLGNIDVFEAPNIIPNDYAVCVYKNMQNPADVAIAYSTYLPFSTPNITPNTAFNLSQTPTLTYPTMYSEKGIFSVQADKVINREYMGVIKFTNLDLVHG